MRALLFVSLLLSGCTNNRYVNLVRGLHEHQVPSCVRADLGLGGLFGLGAGAGTLRVISATGAAPMRDCLRLGTLPADDPTTHAMEAH